MAGETTLESKLLAYQDTELASLNTLCIISLKLKIEQALKSSPSSSQQTTPHTASAIPLATSISNSVSSEALNQQSSPSYAAVYYRFNWFTKKSIFCSSFLSITLYFKVCRNAMNSPIGIGEQRAILKQ